MTDAQARRLAEVRYLVLEYEITPAAQRPPVANAKIAQWRRELDRLTRLAQESK